MPDVESPNAIDELSVTVVVRIKHAELYAAAKKLGSQAALAEYLCVDQSELGAWCNLGRCPPLESNPRRPKWPQERIDDLERKLFGITGKTLRELFPPALSGADAFLRSNKTREITKTVQLDRLLEYAEFTTARLTAPEPDQAVIASDLSDDIQKVLKTLSDREREIIKLRFGLDGGETHTLEECSRMFKCGRERIRQIEAKALNKMKQPNRSQILIGHHQE